MAEYPLPNPSLPFGQQAVSPVAQTNPIQSLTQGGVQGFSLGLQARQQAMLQQQQQMEQEKQKFVMEQAAKEEKRKSFEDFTKAVSTLHAMPESIRPQIWDNMVYPKAKELGLNVSPGYDSLSDHPFTEDVKKILDYHKKNPKDFPLDDALGAIHLKALTASEQGQAETSKTMMDIAESMRPKESPLAESQALNRDFRIQSMKKNIVDEFNKDASVKKSQQSLDASGDIKNLALSGNPIAAAAIPTYSARMSGEVGNLSEADKRPFGGSQAINKRLDATLTQMATGGLTPDNQKFIIGLADIVEKRSHEKMDAIAKKYAKQYSSGSPYFKEDDLFNAIRPGVISGGEDFSSMSDEELRRIASGKP